MSTTPSDLMPTVNCIETAFELPGKARELAEKTALELAIVGALEVFKESLKPREDVIYAIVAAEQEDLYALCPEEIQLLSSRARRSRRANWTSGRLAARLALAKLGVKHSAPILRGNGGEPIWPDGITGSITHCDPWSVAVAARCKRRSRTIGIDLESGNRMDKVDPKAIAGMICRGAELEWVREGDVTARLTMIFSAKEALYKALYPLCKRYIDFNEVELSWSREKSRFHSKFLPSFTGDLPAIEGCEISCHQYQHLFFSCSVIELPE